MSYLDRLKARIAETGLPVGPTEPTEQGFVGFVGSPNGSVSEFDPVRKLAAWRAALALIDPAQPRADYTPTAWWLLHDDAHWLLDTFGERAARFGWSAADLFGVWPAKPNWGGIADRLRGARTLVMDADRAHWRSWGQIDRFNRGTYPDLRPLWD